MTEATIQALLSVLRSLMIVGGSWLTARGYLSESNTSEVIGAITVLLPLLWGAWQKFTAETMAKAREVVAVNVGIAVANATDGPAPAVPAGVVPELIKATAP